MFSERINDGINRDPEHYFKRANNKNPENGGAKKARFGETPTERKAYLVEQRQRWAELQNRHLERHQHKARVDPRSLKAQGIERLPEKHLGVAYVRKLDIDQLHAIMAYREAEKQVEARIHERNSVIDVTTSLREVLLERDIQAEKHAHPPEQEPLQGRAYPVESETLNIDKAVNDALKEIQEEIDIQSLVNDAMPEFQGIHQEMVEQQARMASDEQQRKDEKARQPRADEKTKKKNNQGWSFSR
jgi:hypothetical protein